MCSVGACASAGRYICVNGERIYDCEVGEEAIVMDKLMKITTCVMMESRVQWILALDIMDVSMMPLRVVISLIDDSDSYTIGACCLESGTYSLAVQSV